MNLHHITLVQTTFPTVQTEADLFVNRLYEHLFRLDPCLCYLFPREMAAHKQKFIAALGEIVAGLERPFPLIQHTLKPLGRRHTHYGIQPAHYHTFATALHHALAATLGTAFTTEVAAAWMEAYYLVVGIMKETRD
ncbi:MAG: hemin receptor [Ardenticatenaceae bacterium]|nr:hemin receptor [Ardenticatenaceae bacterium]